MEHNKLLNDWFHLKTGQKGKPPLEVILSVLLGLGLLISVDCWAQSPGYSRFITPKQPLPEVPEYSPTTSNQPFQLPDLIRPTKADNKNALAFNLKGIQFIGNKRFSDQQLHQLIKHAIGQPISYSGLESIRSQLTQYYINAGYINSGVLLTDQHITDGIVTFKVIEGSLAKINITGAERLHNSYIRKRIEFNPDEILDKDSLHDKFQLLLTDPLIERLNGQLRPGDKAGESILDLEVTRARPYRLYLATDNYTTPAIGSYTGRLGGSVSNLTGLGDRLALELSYSEGSQSIDSRLSIPFNYQGSRAFIAFQANHAEVIEDSFKALDIESNFYNIELGVSHPVYRRLNRLFTIQALFSYRKTDTSVLGWKIPLSEGVEKDGEAKVSVIRLNQAFVNRTANQVISLSSLFNIGFDSFNATVNKDQADSRFFSWIGQALVTQQLLDNGTQIVLRANIQLSNDSLLSLEDLALGGVDTVRGYRENTLVRDEGYSVSAEIRYPLYKNSDHSKLEITPFSDYASGWNHNNEKQQSLFSAGVGLRWHWYQFDASVFWAHTFKPSLSSPDYDLQDDGVHFQLSRTIF